MLSKEGCCHSSEEFERRNRKEKINLDVGCTAVEIKMEVVQCKLISQWFTHAGWKLSGSMLQAAEPDEAVLDRMFSALHLQGTGYYADNVEIPRLQFCGVEVASCLKARSCCRAGKVWSTGCRNNTPAVQPHTGAG